MKQNHEVVVIGLGYVGLPLAIHLAKHNPLIGFDISQTRVDELKKSIDRTHEVSPENLRTSLMKFTTSLEDIKGKDIYIVTVPTPITDAYKPDLTPLESASKIVGQSMKKGSIVVYESTVYPGVTEGFCGGILEKVSGLKRGVDFSLGYSPERINPGDKTHTVDKITKVVAGDSLETEKILKDLYGKINGGNVFMARNIRTAEASKVIENTQRDINIAFMNEITVIFSKMGISIYDVLDAAKTKWNFLSFSPGLVGGHCIGVDPYYLVEAAQNVGVDPGVLLAGREINESMGSFIANRIQEGIQEHKLKKPARILILGITFKENVPDLRNSKVIDVIKSLQDHGHHISVHDPLADPHEVKAFFGMELVASLDQGHEYDVVVGAVPHDVYRDFSATIFQELMPKGGLVFDIKNMWSDLELTHNIKYMGL